MITTWAQYFSRANLEREQINRFCLNKICVCCLYSPLLHAFARNQCRTSAAQGRKFVYYCICASEQFLIYAPNCVFFQVWFFIRLERHNFCLVDWFTSRTLWNPEQLYSAIPGDVSIRADRVRRGAEREREWEREKEREREERERVRYKGNRMRKAEKWFWKWGPRACSAYASCNLM